MYKILLMLLPLAAMHNINAQERFIVVNGDSIRINTAGLDTRQEGQPVIVFESGAGTPMGNWSKVLPAATELGPVVTYDRAGIGESKPDGKMPTIEHVSNRLISILDQLDLAPPYLLVGHSLGGVYVRGFAMYHPELLAGLVIIDPGDFTETQENKRDYYEVFDWGEDRIDMEINKEVALRESRRTNAPPSIQRESEYLEQLRRDDFGKIKNTPLPNIPVHIITGGRFDMPDQMRSKEYDSEALFRSKMRHRIARWTDVVQSVDKGMLFYSGDAGHFVQWDDPELVVSSIRLALNDFALLRSDK